MRVSKVTGHWREVDGKRVWVGEHDRAGGSGSGGSPTVSSVGLADRIPASTPPPPVGTPEQAWDEVGMEQAFQLWQARQAQVSSEIEAIDRKISELEDEMRAKYGGALPEDWDYEYRGPDRAFHRRYWYAQEGHKEIKQELELNHAELVEEQTRVYREARAAYADNPSNNNMRTHYMRMKQIHDDVAESKSEIASLKDEVRKIKTEVARFEQESGITEMRERIFQLKHQRGVLNSEA